MAAYDSSFNTDVSKSPFERAQEFTKYVHERSDYKFWDTPVIKSIELVECEVREKNAKDKTKPLCHAAWKLKVVPELLNSGHNLHGGAVATIFDMLTSFAITAQAKENWWELGTVSRTLNCTYLKPIPEGEYARVECEVTSLGKKLGLCRAVMRKWNPEKADGSGGEICYTCEHGKVNLGPVAKL
ncbi:uncharacterized protein J3D65DRAFT_667259 [Phyllosticta citribraziliensis]|uniref:Thioesterase domain-containing protein n=1 Tax=Phyllosticta citribraziliensis TaxID=989973 RepID=A0ABR1LTU8_9PEZI